MWRTEQKTFTNPDLFGKIKSKCIWVDVETHSKVRVSPALHIVNILHRTAEPVQVFPSDKNEVLFFWFVIVPLCKYLCVLLKGYMCRACLTATYLFWLTVMMRLHLNQLTHVYLPSFSLYTSQSTTFSGTLVPPVFLLLCNCCLTCIVIVISSPKYFSSILCIYILFFFHCPPLPPFPPFAAKSKQQGSDTLEVVNCVVSCLVPVCK